MNSAEAMGHIAVAAGVGLLALFLGLSGLLAGIAIFVIWTISTNKRNDKKINP